MKNIYKKVSLFCALLLAQSSVSAQCGIQQTGGTATNMFSLIRNNTSSIAYNKLLNTIVFIHRNDVASFNGSSGNLRYDISTNGGTSWTLNQGVLNPTNSNYARYPNVAIYNPSANTNTANAYVSYMAPTINSVSAAWTGEVTGVQNFTGSGTTETYNQNGIGTTWQAGSLVTGAPGVFWAIDPLVPSSLTGFNIYKGTWNSTISDITWTISYVCSPSFNTTYSSPVITDYNIAFDPTGQIGYFSFLGHVTPGPSQYGLYPVLYKTTNGGASWTGPLQVDLTQFSCITSNTVSPNVPSTNIEHDLVVDVNGNPHLITTLGNASNYNFNYSTWHHMYDITLKSGLWVAYDLGNVQGAPGTIGVSPNYATQWQSPQAARTNDGTKIFFTWTDNSNYSLGAANVSPDLFGKAYNVTNDTWTPTKNFTSCSSTFSGSILYPHMAPEVIEPTNSSFKLAVVYGKNSVPGDVGQVADFEFLDNITFATSEFSLTAPAATVTIQQAPLVLICPGSSVTINVSGPSQAIWSNSATTSSISITTSSVTSYSVIAQSGCNVGTTSIAVANLSVNATAQTTGICPGGTVSFTALGNALGYTWTPGSITGTNVVLHPSSNTVTLTTLGSNSCTSTQTVAFNLLAQPSITIAGSSTICAGTVLTETASGAQSYQWNGSATGATFTDTPLTNTTYVVVGTAANTCTNTQTVSVVVKPSPTVVAVASPTAICNGQTVTLNASGAASYSWNAAASTSTSNVTPTVTTIYTVTGAGTNLCQTSNTVEVVVYALPSITITPSRPGTFCKGEKINLIASGANTYTWVSPGVLIFSVQVYPTVTTVYSVSATSTAGCEDSKTYTLTVSPCTGIDEHSLSSSPLLIYPNPNNGQFVVKGGTEIQLTLVNELGQTIRTLHLDADNAYEAKVEDLPGGIYFLVGEQDGLTVKQKLVIAR